MTPNLLATIILGLIGIIVTVVLAVKADRNAQQRRLESVIQSMVVEKFEAVFKDLGDLGGRMTMTERRHERLLGRLEGRGILRHDQDELEEGGK
jgi:hypothetical protein